jgi:hypothetical protein
MKKITLLIFLIITSFIGCDKKDDSQPKTQQSSNTCVSSQCVATATSTGNRCKNMTTNCVSLCHTHN